MLISSQEYRLTHVDINHSLSRWKEDKMRTVVISYKKLGINSNCHRERKRNFLLWVKKHWSDLIFVWNWAKYLSWWSRPVIVRNEASVDLDLSAYLLLLPSTFSCWLLSVSCLWFFVVFFFVTKKSRREEWLRRRKINTDAEDEASSSYFPWEMIKCLKWEN